MKMNNIEFSEVLKRVSTPCKTAIVCHKNPDPDCIGSAVGLSCILEHFGSDTAILCSEKLPARLSFMTDGKEIYYNGDFSEYGRVFCVDVASPSQMGELDKLCDKVDMTIDHHAMSTRFSDFYMENSAACAQIIYKIGEALGILEHMPKNFFEAIYAGISGDTGCFKYSNVTDETHIIASSLVSRDIDYAEINRLIFDSKTIGEIEAEKLTYQNMQLKCDGKLAIITFTNEMKQKSNVTDEDIGDIVNHIRQIEGVSVAISIKQSSNNENKFSVSSRSNKDVDVSMLCAKLGGGGHIRAAGCTVTAESPKEAEEKIISVFAEEIVKNG